MVQFIRLPLVGGCSLSVGSAPPGKFSNRTSFRIGRAGQAAESLIVEVKRNSYEYCRL